MNNTDNSLSLDVTQKINWAKQGAKYDQSNLMYWNINSIRNKLFDIEEIVIQKRAKTNHFIALIETRISENETDLFNVPNYNAFFSSRSDEHGGAALYVHDSLDSNLIASNVEFKTNYVIVNFPILKTSIAVVYKKPTVSTSKFILVLNKIFDHTNKIILIGDSNIDIQLQNNCTEQYISALNSADCCLLNNRDKKFATRVNESSNARNTLSSTIDHVISNNSNLKFNIGLNDSHLSDHKNIFVSFRDTTIRTVDFASKTQNFDVNNLGLP